jgi:hypothetical protein
MKAVVHFWLSSGDMKIEKEIRDAMLLDLKLEEIALSQGMEAACRN